MRRRPHVLVTNDDGIDAPGLLALAHTACEQGYDVTVAAPHRQASGCAGGLTMFLVDERIEVSHRRLPGLPGVEAYAVAAHPGMIALAAVLGRFGPVPDLVLSGINEGSNLGAAVLHSGTASAAMVAGAHGVTALAASLHLDFEIEQPAAVGAARHWDTAAAVVDAILPNIMSADAGSVFNLNVPNLPGEQVRPLVAAPWTLAGTAPTLLPFIAAFDRHADALPVQDLPSPDITIVEGSDIAHVRGGHPTLSLLRWNGDTAIEWVDSVLT
ncbi:5'/3'-nucleotidase SurE [Rhodococcus sp. ZPP]|uniref:5'/3'-nucleotidase SurE n=1 Tax=Rhodococcus sp. ZPP TaxID=2749906 RepID=UPI001AD86E17|nr:5'/3'-nucleotidase SurE [Rhodococcus sp. ZPP]QTJ68562.1 5'/3'-nucleotidase SurE [Rhodococcus sp. ZPP]